MAKFTWRRGVTALAVVPLLALAACSSSGGKPADSGSCRPAAARPSDTPRIKVAMITHAAAGDTFWDIVRKGAETAAKKDNVELLYSGDAEGGRQAQLVQQAIDQKVDGIARHARQARSAQGRGEEGRGRGHSCGQLQRR